AMNQLAAGGGGVFGQIVLFTEKDPQATSGCIGRYTRTVDAAADYCQVVDLRQRCGGMGVRWHGDPPVGPQRAALGHVLHSAQKGGALQACGETAEWPQCLRG